MAESLLVADDGSLWVGSGQWQDGLFEPSLLISRDQGAAWNERLREVNNPSLDTSFGFSSPIGFGPIDRLLIDANDSNLVWAHTRYWFMQSRDAGASWTLFAPGLEQGAYGQSVDRQPYIMQKTAGEDTHFIVDPMSPSRNLYRSRDQGQTWQFVQERVSAAMVHGTSLYASSRPPTLAQRQWRRRLAAKLPTYQAPPSRMPWRCIPARRIFIWPMTSDSFAPVMEGSFLDHLARAGERVVAECQNPLCPCK